MIHNYNNQVVTCTPHSTPDPFVTASHGKWYLTFTSGDRIEIWCSSSPFDFLSAFRHVIWRPPPSTPYSSGIWAPELHALSGRWYVYFAAEDPAHGNRSHRMYVLGGPPSTHDPCTPDWTFLGPVQGLPQDQWAIDGTVIHLHGRPYFVYSGWPLGEHESDKTQELFIAAMVSPTAVLGDRPPTRISTPDREWERSGESGINEGPQFLCSPPDERGVSGWIGIVYSCAGSWTRDYKMATLRYVGGSEPDDPLNPANWPKSAEPLLASSPDGSGPYGPGHGTFVPIGPREMVAVFHATDKPTDGWENRKARCQAVTWTDEGPWMGRFVGMLVRGVPGEVRLREGEGGGGWVNRLKSSVIGRLEKFL